MCGMALVTSLHLSSHSETSIIPVFIIIIQPLTGQRESNILWTSCIRILKKIILAMNNLNIHKADFPIILLRNILWRKQGALSGNWKYITHLITATVWTWLTSIWMSWPSSACPYDNAPMERYFNTLKNQCTDLYEFRTEESLYQNVEEFAYIHYNHVHPQNFNRFRIPYQARIESKKETDIF